MDGCVSVDRFEPVPQAGVTVLDTDRAMEGGDIYRTPDDGTIAFNVDAGDLTGLEYLVYDALLDGVDTARFVLSLSDGDRTFDLEYLLLNQCQARIRLPLDALEQGSWSLGREGAWLKPVVWGERISPDDIGTIELRIESIVGDPVDVWQTPLFGTEAQPERLSSPALPRGHLLDEFGQHRLRDWDGKTADEAALAERLSRQRDLADGFDDDRNRDRWGGWTDRSFVASGFFDVECDGDRWWLVTPDGHPFWSVGVDCVQPDAVRTRFDGIEDALAWLPAGDGRFADALDQDGGMAFVSYLATNYLRVFSPESWRDAWADIAFGLLDNLQFNTLGNWSDWESARDRSKPYVRQLDLSFEHADTVFRDFPDVFADGFESDVAALATQLEATRDDPAMLGYFLDNEPTYLFADYSPAAGALLTTETCATRRRFAAWLKSRYADGDALATAWSLDATFGDVRTGVWETALTDAAREDCRTFSTELVDRFYRTLTAACRDVDPNHLVLGVRTAGKPPTWALRGMDHFDVFTVNCHRPAVPDDYEQITVETGAPVLVGEWHFGAGDVGLPTPAIQIVDDQTARANAYRTYLEGAAAQPWCVGAHFFSMYDQSALGRFDGENFNFGLFDVCHRPYQITEAASESHDHLYAVAAGQRAPFSTEVAVNSLFE